MCSSLLIWDLGAEVKDSFVAQKLKAGRERPVTLARLIVASGWSSPLPSPQGDFRFPSPRATTAVYANELRITTSANVFRGRRCGVTGKSGLDGSVSSRTLSFWFNEMSLSDTESYEEQPQRERMKQRWCVCGGWYLLSPLAFNPHHDPRHFLWYPSFILMEEKSFTKAFQRHFRKQDI